MPRSGLLAREITAAVRLARFVINPAADGRAGRCGCAASAGSGYRRREPERTLLHATVRGDLKTFLAGMEQRDDCGDLPGFVIRVSSPDPLWTKKQAAYLEGFSLHAGVHVHANDREGLAHLCGYGARPPLAQNRLSQLADGRLVYRLERPLAEGAGVLILEPCELLRRLAALVPPPRAHLVRYHGVFGPASAWRSEIVPRPQKNMPAPRPDPNSVLPVPDTTPRRDSSRIPWRELLLRVFREDVLVCPCGGRRVVLAFVTEKKVVRKIVEHLGLLTTGPPIAPARIAAAGDEAPWQDEVTELQ